jgi:hypothetical protein
MQIRQVRNSADEAKVTHEERVSNNGRHLGLPHLSDTTVARGMTEVATEVFITKDEAGNSLNQAK